MKKCVIISGGVYTPAPEIGPEDFVIACDKGCGYAKRDGIVPDLAVGDFDSYDGTVDPDIPIQRYRKEKDDTDTMIAVRYAVEHGFDEIEITSALGLRLDHTFANIQSACYAVERGLFVRMADENSDMLFMTDKEVVLPKRKGWSLSVFAITDRCTGVNIGGAKYPLDDATVTNTWPVGVSNEWRDDEARISVGSGILMILMSNKSEE